MISFRFLESHFHKEIFLGHQAGLELTALAIQNTLYFSYFVH